MPPEDRHIWAVLTLEPASGKGNLLTYRDPRRFGVLEVTRKPEFRERLGVDPFDAAFDPDAVAAAMARRRAPIKMVLLDQRIVAGLGSIYADELCFLAGVYPTTPACDVPADRLAIIVNQMRPLLERAIAARGATIQGSPYRDVFGVAEEFRPQAYGRGGLPCTRCGTTMEWARVGGGKNGRSYTYCPVCQPVK
jgi:formamidopyrimidine-DNA glycosylase